MPKIQAPSIAEHRELRRHQLITAALELAMSGGAEAVTVSAVAQKAGLSRSSIYEYFASSADLIADLVVEELNYYTDRLALAINDAHDPFEKIELWIAEGLRYVQDGLEALEIRELADLKVTELSLGQQQRVSVALALIQAASYYLLDEPLSAQDASHQDRTLDLLSMLAKEHGILVVAHNSAAFKARFDAHISL